VVWIFVFCLEFYRDFQFESTDILNRCLASVTSQSLRCAESSRMLVEHIFGDGVLTLKSTQSAASNPRPRVTRRGGKRKKKSRKSVRTVVVEHAAGVADTPQKSNNVNQVKSFVRRRILRSFHLFDQIIQRHRRLPYSLLLLRHCPLKKNADRTSVHPDSSPSQVCRFALAVLRRLLPLQLLGSVHNRRILSASMSFGLSFRLWFNFTTPVCSDVCRYIRLRRNESVSVHHLVQNIKVGSLHSSFKFSLLHNFCFMHGMVRFLAFPGSLDRLISQVVRPP
jgi:hypothetical protein